MLLSKDVNLCHSLTMSIHHWYLGITHPISLYALKEHEQRQIYFTTTVLLLFLLLYYYRVST